MFDHVTIRVSHRSASEHFYRIALGRAGHRANPRRRGHDRVERLLDHGCGRRAPTYAAPPSRIRRSQPRPCGGVLARWYERRGSVLVRHGKGEKRREAGMGDWGFEHLTNWLERRTELPIGPPFCVIDGSTRGRSWSSTAVRAELRRLAAEAGVRRRFAPHQLRHAHAAELAREGVAVNLIQRQLGHTTWALPRHTSRASTLPRSSRRCTRAVRR
jgi:catechol 2,3-dioxygenase-like lactoylglutathione lyase family enzyme